MWDAIAKLRLFRHATGTEPSFTPLFPKFFYVVHVSESGRNLRILPEGKTIESFDRLERRMKTNEDEPISFFENGVCFLEVDSFAWS